MLSDIFSLTYQNYQFVNNFFKLIVIQIYVTLHYLLALLYNFTSGKKYIPSCGRDESKTSFPLQEGIFVCSRVLLHHDQ